MTPDPAPTPEPAPTPDPAPPGRRVRARLVVTVMGVVAVAALALSVLADVLVARSIEAAIVERALDEARFTVEVLAAERLGPQVQPGDIESSGLADDLARRGLAVYVDLGGQPGDDFVSGLSAVRAREVISDELRALVATGNLGAERVTLDGVPTLVVGARRPPSGPDLYLLTDLGELTRTRTQLRTVLAIASLALVLLAGAVGWRGARLAGRLADSVAALTAARDRERRFVADVSHELRTPVTALVAEAAELSAEVEALPAASRRTVELLDRDVRRLRDLVEELLELSRLDAADPHADLEVAEVDLVRFLDAVVSRRLPGTEVRCRPGLTVRTDRRRLERVVTNLVDNARVHADGAEVTVSAGLDGGHLVVEVADRGPGVPPAQLPHLFDRFTKGDAARGGSGSGLGLAITWEHVRVLDGTVTATNRVGGGLAVTVQVPVEVVTEP